MDAATQVVAAAVRVVASASRAGVLGVHPAPLAPVAVAQVAIEVARKASSTSGAPSAVLPVVETWPVLATALEAATTLGVADARPLGAAAQVAKDVVVDGARAPVPRVATQAVAGTGVLVASANVATSRVGATGRGAGGGTCAASSLVARLEVATAIPTTRARGPRVPVRAADARGARPVVAEGVAGVVATPLPSVATPSVASIVLPTTPARVPARADVAPRLTKVAVTVAGRAEVEATAGLVPVATVGPLLAKDHAVAHPDVVGRASGLAHVPSVQDSS